ncbi:hypothetical protein [Micromonospora sp. NPDC048839]|uniref:hypothetical protein n=1 Tax=Micromonospora sp. NPDC048839 TaxID=3155641 RepID=UPI0033E872AF
MSHVLPLGGTGWSAWRDVVLRTAGFPAEGLTDVAAPDAADGLLAQRGRGHRAVTGTGRQLGDRRAEPRPRQ